MDLTNNGTLLGIATLLLALVGVGLILGQSAALTTAGILMVIGSGIVFITDVQTFLTIPEEKTAK